MKFARQIFISYAHLDNQPLSADQSGWVSLFHSTLQTLLSQRLGAPADIWRDDKLHGNDDFSDEILVMFRGNVVERGPSDEVILNPQDVTEGMAVSSDPAAAAQMPADAGMGAVMMG